MRRVIRLWLVAVAVLAWPLTARAEWQAKPFGGLTFGGGSPFVDLDRVQGKPRLNLGLSALWLGEVVGIEADVATTSGFFSGEAKRILHSHVATVSGNVVIALPKRIAEYTLRPYVVGGLGFAHVSFTDGVKTYDYSNVLPAWDVGGGATGFISDTVGLNWDVRLFRTLRPERPNSTGAVVEEKKLSFWRATMGISIRL